MSDSFQEKKDGLQLLAALSDENTKAILVRSFQSHLSELVVQILSADCSNEQAMALRHEARGVMAVLDRIGVQTANASEAAVRRATQRRVLQAVNEDVG